MRPIKRPDHNFTYKGPTPDIGDLSCEVFIEPPETRVVRSHWRPSRDELTVLLEGGSVELDVLTGGPLPPLAVNVAPEIDGEGENRYRQVPRGAEISE